MNDNQYDSDCITYSDERPTVIHSYIASDCLVTAPGLGDFLRGCFTIYMLALKYKLNFEIDFNNHLLRNFLITKDIKEPEVFHNICRTNGDIFNMLREHKSMKPLYVLTNYHSPENYTKLKSEDPKRVYIKQYFQFKKEFSLMVKERIESQGINFYNYNCIIIRLGDHGFNNYFNLDKKLLVKLDEQYDKGNFSNSIVLCESLKAKQFLGKRYNLINLGTSPGHPARTSNIKEIEDVAIDLFTLINSKKNISTRTIFTEAFSELFEIPYEWLGWSCW